MSRFIRKGGESGSSGVDLSTCALSTNQPITTSSSFCGSGNTLCNTRWDLVCSFTNNSQGCIGSSLQIDLPTDRYSEFELVMCNLCSIAGVNTLLMANSGCRCSCASSIKYCTLEFTYASSVYGWLVCDCSSTSFSVPIYPPVSCVACCPGKSSFSLYLKKVHQDSGVCFYYCANQFSCTCFRCQLIQGVASGSSCANIAWNCNCAVTCRFTNVYICNSCGLSIGSDFSYLIFGLKDTVYR